MQQVLDKFRAGDFDTAATLLDRILAASADHPDLLHLGAMIALRRGRAELAHDYALRALGAHPDRTAIRYTRAQALAALQRHEEALAELRRVLIAEPDCHKAHLLIWEIMSARGQLDESTNLVKQRLAALGTQCATIELPAIKMQIPDTTLCCVDCRNHALAIRALKLSLAGCDFPRAMLFTDQHFDLMPIETVMIKPIHSLPEYSEFVTKQLLHYIDTEYVLLIQWDGYVVCPGAWSEQFLLFDYIGARWPHEELRIPAEHAVGNGGFSLRSRTLLEALQDPRIVQPHPDDGAICLTYRRYLEQQHGIAFAPAAVADRFSFEHIEPTGPTFGFHGQVNISRFVDDVAIRLLETA